jgi:hypothetical protein
MLRYGTNLNTEHRIKKHVALSINDPLPAFHRKKNSFFRVDTEK